MELPFSLKLLQFGCSSWRLIFTGEAPLEYTVGSLSHKSSLGRWVLPVCACFLLGVECSSWSPPRLGSGQILAQCSSGASQWLVKIWAGLEGDSTPLFLLFQNQGHSKQRSYGRRMGLWLWLCEGQAVSSVEPWVPLRICWKESIPTVGSGVFPSRTKGLCVLMSLLSVLDASVICSMHLFWH